jgi:hypothetical protein
MAYTQTSNIALDKAVVGTNQAFETTKVNSNWDKVDSAFATVNLTPRVQTVLNAGVTINGGTA